MTTWRTLRNNPTLWPRYFIREKVITAIRRFFLDRQFHEVETPYLTGSLPPESYLDIFQTTLYDRNHNARPAYLPTSPEPFLKKLLVAGIGNCFAIPKSFRNTEDMSKTHNPEFTILEWYRVQADYIDIMQDCEELLQLINTYLKRSKKGADAGNSAMKLTYQGKEVDLKSPWERLTMRQAWNKYIGVDLTDYLTLTPLAKLAKSKGYQIGEEDSWEEIFHLLYLNEVVPNFPSTKPLIIYDYPAQLAALAAKKKTTDPRYIERFEVYINRIELADCCTELTDWHEQKERFQNELNIRKRLGKSEYSVDEEFIEALKLGMPQCAGIALGVDRLIMLFADVTNIADTMFFPAKDLFPSEM